MLSLRNVAERFQTRFEIIENGSGTFSGIINEIVLNNPPAGIFNMPNRIVRVAPNLPLLSGMVIRSEAGTVYLVAEHGYSESWEGPIFRAFRIFPTFEKFAIERQVKQNEVVTGLPKTESLDTVATVWGIYQPQPEIFDRGTRVSDETGRFITNYPLQRGDMVRGKRVFRVDKELGLYIATLS
jgi:hypothetical protein